MQKSLSSACKDIISAQIMEKLSVKDDEMNRKTTLMKTNLTSSTTTASTESICKPKSFGSFLNQAVSLNNVQSNEITFQQVPQKSSKLSQNILKSSIEYIESVNEEEQTTSANNAKQINDTSIVTGIAIKPSDKDVATKLLKYNLSGNSKREHKTFIVNQNGDSSAKPSDICSTLGASIISNDENSLTNNQQKISQNIFSINKSNLES
jgi:hypothetical protein